MAFSEGSVMSKDLTPEHTKTIIELTKANQQLEDDLRIRNAELNFSIGAVKNYDGKIKALTKQNKELHEKIHKLNNDVMSRDFKVINGKKAFDKLRALFNKHLDGCLEIHNQNKEHIKDRDDKLEKIKDIIDTKSCKGHKVRVIK